MRWERELGDALRELARSADVVPEKPETERLLLEAFDRRGALPRKTVRRGGIPSGWHLAAAASVALLAGAWWIAPRAGEQGQTVPRMTAGTEAGAPRTAGTEAGATGAAGTKAGATGVAQVAGPAKHRPLPTKPRRAVPLSPSTEVSADVEEFIALPAADRLPRFESGMIVRVELDVTSLPAFGFPIMPDSGQRPVTADVLVGQDGQPRAIRLVSVQPGSRSYR
jgi:hypothetical protein